MSANDPIADSGRNGRIAGCKRCIGARFARHCLSNRCFLPVSLRMIVDLQKLNAAEILLLAAVEGMEGQHHVPCLYDLVIALLRKYGLELDMPGYQTSRRFVELVSLEQKYKREVGYGTSNPMRGDRSALNKRSDNLLILLAGQCKEGLSDRRGGMDHLHMSAGELACFQLASYGLLVKEGRGGRWTSAGEAAVKLALSEQFAPLKDFTFADLD